jgi:hypothetical protein
MLQEALASSGFKLVGIGQGNLKALKSWARLNKWPGELYSDMDQPKLPAFAALGAVFKPDPTPCSKTCWRALLGTAFGISVVWCRGCPPSTDLTAGVASNNFLVQAGVVCFGEAGSVLLSRHMRDISTPLPAEEVAEVLRLAVKSPS